jgi:putative DNA primase/helicase
MTKPISWYARRYTERYGFSIVPIESGRKFPTTSDWGNHTLSDPDAAEAFYQSHSDWNMGLALADSRMCSLDIDDAEAFSTIMAEFGIPESELNGYPTIEGKGRRIMFRVPDGASLPYHKLTWPKQDDPKKRYTVIELRAATDGKQRQDVLPPSMHPDTGKPYRWAVQPPKPDASWPTPPAWLLSIWEAWDKFKPQLQDACPWAERAPEPEPARPRQQHDGVDVIGAYNDAHDLRRELERYGYAPKGKRFLSPHSGTGLPGVVVFPSGVTAWVHHASDPLCSEESGQPVSAFDLFRYYDHGDDYTKAVRAAAEELGIKRERPAPVSKAQEAPPPPENNQGPAMPFKPLGYNGTAYYYLPRGTEQVCSLRRGAHTSAGEMLSMAPLEWWEMAYPKPKGGVDWQAAANDCMRSCERAGIYSLDRERGRGAWYDEGRAVLHLGGHMLVDGTRHAISDHKTRFIYTRQPPLEHGADAEPAPDGAAIEVASIFQELNWSQPGYASLLAGWCFLAPICGALPWRPHVWLTAKRGGGKTWIQDHIIAPLLGPSALMVQGSTTEAGIRQKLRQDARPIVFDEAESENQRAQSRMQTVLELARQSSSDSTAEIAKGTADGEGMAFRMRSMFLMGSINVSLAQAADESRFSVLSLRTPDKTSDEIARFDEFAKRVDNLLTPDLCASIRARAYHLMPVVRENAATFARAVAEVIGSQRIGDQVGTLLAGHWGMLNSSIVSLDEARRSVEGMDFSDASDAEEVSDEESCLAKIIESQVRFDTDHGPKTRTIGEIIDCAAGNELVEGMTKKDANRVLKRFGLAVDAGCLFVANSHTELEKLLRGTPWAAGWRRVLSRLDGAESTAHVRFAGSRSRAVSVPIESLL